MIRSGQRVSALVLKGSYSTSTPVVLKRMCTIAIQGMQLWRTHAVLIFALTINQRKPVEYCAFSRGWSLGAQERNVAQAVQQGLFEQCLLDNRAVIIGIFWMCGNATSGGY